MQIVPYSVHEILVQLIGGGLRNVPFFLEFLGDVSQPSLFFVFGYQSGDLSCGENHIDVLQELFFFDFGVSHDKGEIFAGVSGLLEILFDFLLEIFFSEGFGQDELLDDISTYVCGEPGERLFSRTTHSD